EEYDGFVDYVVSFDVSYTTDTEKAYEKLLTTAKEEEYFADAHDEFEALRSKIKPYGKNDLYKFRKDVQLVLENEIVARYYYQQGRIEATLAKDKAIENAKVVLHNGSYNDILSVNYTKK